MTALLGRESCAEWCCCKMQRNIIFFPLFYPCHPDTTQSQDEETCPPTALWLGRFTPLGPKIPLQEANRRVPHPLRVIWKMFGNAPENHPCCPGTGDNHLSWFLSCGASHFLADFRPVLSASVCTHLLSPGCSSTCGRQVEGSALLHSAHCGATRQMKFVQLWVCPGVGGYLVVTQGRA